MYLLDTNVISEIRRLYKGKCNSNVANWVNTVSSDLMYTNAIVMMELERGVLAIERKDKAQGQNLRNWLDNQVKPSFVGKILPITDKTAQICATLHIPDHAPENDAWIASTALEHRLILVTRNVADFAKTGVKVFNPFEPTT